MIGIVQRIIELRETDDPPSFSEIAGVLNAEFPGELFTKDKVRGIYTRNREVAPATSRKVVVLGDVHSAPDPELLDAVIREQPDIIVVAGDLLDSQSLSQHEPNVNERRKTMREEIEQCREYLKSLSGGTTSQIYVMMGNHDHRWQKQAQKLLPTDLLEMVGSPLELAVAGIDRVELVTTLFSIRGRAVSETPYLFAVGDALISHMNFSAKHPGGGAKKLYDWMHEWHRTLRLPDIRLYIQAHGHKRSVSSVEGGEVVLVEPGSVASPVIDEYKLKYEGKWTPSQQGFCSFVQQQEKQQWLTNLDSIRIVFR